MAKKSGMTAEASPQKSDPRSDVVEALLRLAAEQPFDSISLGAIAREANISLADLRDLFPSKGAMLAGFMRLMDRKTLTGISADMADQPAHDRVMDVMLRRLDAMQPYKAGLKSIRNSLRTDPVAAIQLNQTALNSWRYLLEFAGIDTTGSLSFMRIQGAVLVFARTFETWLDDDEPDMARTMATLDRELQRGETLLDKAEAVHRFTTPFRDFARSVCGKRRDARRSRHDTKEQAEVF